MKRRKYSRRRVNVCRNKARFGTWQEAKDTEPSQTPYECALCRCFHLTSHPAVW